MSYESIAHEPILDMKAIEEGRSTMSSQQFQREFQSYFLDDSGGYFSAKKMLQCSVPAGDQPTILIQGKKDKEYIFALDPNYSDSETADNFAMCVLEIDEENDRVHLVHTYALAKSDILKRAIYVNYLMNNFNIKYVIADNAGGSKFFNDLETLGALDKKVISFDADFTDEVTTRETKGRYNLSQGKILHLQQFGGRRGWVREANENLQYMIENKKIIFNSAILHEKDLRPMMQSKIPIEELHFSNSEDFKGMKKPNEAKMDDFINLQGWLIEETKKECSLVEMRSGSTGSQVFDLPVNLSKDKSPNRARKDSYSALLLGCWAWRQCIKKLEDSTVSQGRSVVIPRFIG